MDFHEHLQDIMDFHEHLQDILDFHEHLQDIMDFHEHLQLSKSQVWSLSSALKIVFKWFTKWFDKEINKLRVARNQAKDWIVGEELQSHSLWETLYIIYPFSINLIMVDLSEES